VLYWNGTPISAAVSRNAERHAGSNAAARQARGLNSMTIRPLAQGLPPDEEWVTLTYRDLEGITREWKQEWLVFEPGPRRTRLDPGSLAREATALGMDWQTDDVQETKEILFAGKVVMAAGEAAEQGAPRLISNSRDGLETTLPTVFRAWSIPANDGEAAYIRIFTFNVRSAEEFVNEFVRLLEQLPQNGLILDVRGNGGGLIHAAERLLQVLTPRRIEPQPAQFINTPMNLQLCRTFKHPLEALPGFGLGEWIDSMEQSVQTGAVFSLGFPITALQSANDLGQCYFGPAVLIVDALCYSATDIFAAGFQDHEIGPILGVDENTGAGGANVWSHRLLLELMRMSPQTGAASGARYSPLPHGSDLRVAIRRLLRVGRNAGQVLEDLGIVPDHLHHMTRADVLEGNADLLAKAARILSTMQGHSIKATFEMGEGSCVARVEARNVDWINVVVNGRPRGSFDMREGEICIDLARLSGEGFRPGSSIELQGFKENRFVAVTRKTLSSS
jgi:hypothetical protein